MTSRRNDPSTTCTGFPRWRDLTKEERATLPDGSVAWRDASGVNWTKHGSTWTRFSPSSPNLTDCGAPPDDAFVRHPEPRLRIVPTPDLDAPDLHRVDAGQEGGPWRPICTFMSKERAVKMAQSLGLPVDLIALASPTAALRRDYTDANPYAEPADPRLIAAFDLLDAVAQRLPIRDLEARLARLSG